MGHLTQRTLSNFEHWLSTVQLRVMIPSKWSSIILRLILIVCYRVVGELQKRFTNYLQSGDDSHIPSDLERIIFQTVCELLRVYIFLS